MFQIIPRLHHRGAPCVALMLVAACVALAAPASAYETENVFIVIIDGIRNQEAFTDPSHEHIPNIWHNLRPDGTINLNFFDTGETVTTAGHATILGGVRNLLPNNSMNSDNVYPKFPTLFEYYRKWREDSGVPPEQSLIECFAVVGKITILNNIHTCLHPAYGPAYRGSIAYPAPTLPGSASDENTWDKLQEVMDAYHPKLVMVNFAEVDVSGHLRDSYPDLYYQAIEGADTIVQALWDKIQTDTYYKDKSTMIVTTDHGRHDDEHGGWKDHGCGCWGCRHLLFLALGPDVKAGEVVMTRRDQVDIAPTVAHLLGFDVPLAEGSVMTELFTNPEPPAESEPPSTPGNISRTPGMSRNPDIAVHGGVVHVAWAEESMTEGEWEIVYAKSSDGGASWTDPVSVFPDVDRFTYYFPAIAASDAGVYIAVSGFQTADFPDDYGTYTDWGVVGRKLGAGSSHRIHGLAGPVALGPDVAMHGSEIDVVWSYDTFTGGRIVGEVSLDGGDTWQATSVVELTGLNFLLAPRVASTGNGVHATYYGYALGKWEIGYSRTLDPAGDWVTTLVTKQEPNYSLDPSVSVSRRNVSLVWSDLRDLASWQIYYKGSPTNGETWPEAEGAISQSSIGACSPDVASLGRSVLAVWSDFRNDRRGEIYGTLSLNLGADWFTDMSMTPDTRLALNPRLGIGHTGALARAAFLAWQDLDQGSWDIIIKRLAP